MLVEVTGGFSAEERAPGRRPIDIESVVTNTAPEELEAFRTLAQLAHDGYAIQMEQALARVAWGAASARNALTTNATGASEISPKVAEALQAALEADRLRLHRQIKPTDKAMGVIKDDPAFQSLEALVRTDLSAKNQRARNRDMHVLGRLARLAAGR